MTGKITNAIALLRKMQDGELAARKSRLRGGQALERETVRLRVVTPVLGGAAVLRQVDDVDFIRVPTIRGHLRFWWRALYGREYSSLKELKHAERKLFGAAGERESTRSPVRIVVRVENRGDIDRNDVKAFGKDKTPGAYVLWPARSEKKSGLPPAPRRLPGTEFTLTIEAPQERMPEVRNALRAWILFGGYGSRTRRGLGSLTVVGDNADRWLPKEPTREAINALFEGIDDIFAKAEKRDFPQLGGATLLVCELEEDIREDAEACWLEAIGWLEEFRQGVDSGARESDHGKTQSNRPSITNWPEADSVRQLHNGPLYPHKPRYRELAYPRAGLGLPIVGRFQPKGRKRGERYKEPGQFEIVWKGTDGVHQRLASPLILKALPLTGNRFTACALWLYRKFPENGEVGLLFEDRRTGQKSLRHHSAVAFDKQFKIPRGMSAPSFIQVAATKGIRKAFMDEWLEKTHNLKRVAP